MDEADVAGYIKTVLIEHSLESRYNGAIFKIHHFISVDCYNLTALIQILEAGTCAVVSLRRYHHRLREFYSDVNNKSMDTDNKILFWFMLTIPLALGIIPQKTYFLGGLSCYCLTLPHRLDDCLLWIALLWKQEPLYGRELGKRIDSGRFRSDTQ